MVTGTVGMPARPSFAEECETGRIVTGRKIEGAPRCCLAARRVPESELLGDTRQFSYEWQIQDLQDTENERVRKRMKGKGEESGDGQVMNERFRAGVQVKL
jgi:hypothetical protein